MTRPVEWSAEWAGSRVRVTATSNGAALFVDSCDPASAVARARLLLAFGDKVPGVDLSPVEARLLALAAAGVPAQQTDNESSVVPSNPPAWDEEVRGDALLDEIVGELATHVVLPNHAAEAVALWIVHTYCSARFTYSPRLLVSSPDKRCGKSLLLRFVSALVARPLTCENISAAALYRSVEKFSPTLILDEADTFLAGKNVNEDLRGVVNAGHARGGCVLRCVGDDSEPTPFRVFGPLALGMIGRPPSTIEDRSVIVPMRRKLAGETVAKLPPGRPVRELLADTIRRLVRWTTDRGEAMAEAVPVVPKELDDRCGDNWFALLAIADEAGGTWPARARAAAVALSASRDSADSIGLMLLTDLRAIFGEQAADRLKSSTLVALLAARTDRPWPDYRRGRAITERQVGRLLEPFEVRSRQFRTGADQNAVRGYLAEDLADAWGRYLPPAAPDGFRPVTPLQASNGAGYRAIRPVTPGNAVTDGPVTPGNAVTDGIVLQPSNGAGCHAVTGRNGARGETGSGHPSPTPMDDLCALVEDLAADLDALPAGAGPFKSDDLRQHYRDLVRRFGVEAALADARIRYAAHAAGDLMPLPAEVGQ